MVAYQLFDLFCILSGQPVDDPVMFPHHGFIMNFQGMAGIDDVVIGQVGEALGFGSDIFDRPDEELVS